MTTEEFRRAWAADQELRDGVLEEVARWLDKYGDFRQSGYWPQLTTPGVLDDEGVLSLHREIRVRTARCETEWREEFEAAFPHLRHLMPPIDREDLLCTFSYRLFKALVEAPSADRVRQVLREITVAGLHLLEFPRFHSSSVQHKTLVWDDDGDESEEKHLSMLSLARELSTPELTRLLVDAGAE
jgi:hypothetical protein